MCAHTHTHTNKHAHPYKHAHTHTHTHFVKCNWFLTLSQLWQYQSEMAMQQYLCCPWPCRLYENLKWMAKQCWQANSAFPYRTHFFEFSRSSKSTNTVQQITLSHLPHFFFGLGKKHVKKLAPSSLTWPQSADGCMSESSGALLPFFRFLCLLAVTERTCCAASAQPVLPVCPNKHTTG